MGITSSSADDNNTNVGEHHAGILFTLPNKRPADTQQDKAFSALLRLNLFRYTRVLEERNDPVVMQTQTP